ncbi:DNA-binding transcriptional LysR family regulator [Glaciihabitans tibetensis]|uniref:DNA-binding transcriptional LysR family regulator n=1 Tax=Glaciihabitans tibetensis TaxID=1266600 RepID=A0A2T0VJG6_9MICO|nr:LysR family transcriptional regulator [Glaciihabitans tibetensis]PRY70255.1 DNA-binding transcriptional LysR family regulator [Glaciihabitans tibetensis]
MDVDQLAVLRELAERGSITAVAAAMHKTPSAVSQQLRTLQRQTGVPLVERVGRGVVLTDAGHALARSSVQIATAMAEAEATWDAYRGEASGTVRLTVFYSAAELLVPGLMTRLKEHPSIDLKVEDQDVSQDDFAALTADHDIVVAHRSDDVLPPERSALRVVPLLREPLDVALPLDHPLGHRASVSAADVIGEAWIGVPENYPLDRVLGAMAAHESTTARIVYRTTHLPLTEKLVAAGHGIALLPRHTSLQRAEGHFRLVPLSDLRAGRRIEALLRPDRAARRAVQIVLEALRDEARTFH